MTFGRTRGEGAALRGFGPGLVKYERVRDASAR